MSNAQILVVEDERIVARAIQNELECMGYDVPEIASSGPEAVEKTTLSHPDLVLMDISLKGEMDGIEAARRIHDRFDTPVVYLTAYADEATLGRAKITEPYGYLLKPYEERELRTTIEMALYKHRMQEKVKQAERWLAATLRSIDDAVLATDAGQNIRFMNPIAEALTAWDSPAAFGRGLEEVCRLFNEESGMPLDSLARQSVQQSRGIDFPSNTMVRARDGREVPVEGTIAPIHDDEGNFTGVVMAFRDISERRRLESVQRQSEEHLRQSQKMEAVSRLAGGVSHDFNNLLTAILGNTSLVLSKLPGDDPNRDLLGQVETAALRAAELVEQLQCFSGRTRLFLKPVKLNEVIEDMIEVLRRMIDQRITIGFQPDGNLWPVQADAAQINELLINLALNAQDAMPEGGQFLLETENIVITDEDYLLAHPEAKPGEHVHLRVSDTGAGIAPAVRERIFEPFYTTKDPAKGAGLGLSLVYGIVEQHHGWIDCLSEVGLGTRFDIYLPRYWDKPLRATPPLAARPPRSSTRTILLADDEPMIRDLGRSILEGEGYHVLLAEDGMQAVEMYQQDKHHIDLVIVDLTMPRLSGAAVFQQLREIDPSVRVLFSSGYFAEDLTSRDDRCLGFINKPYRHDDLVRMVRAAMEVM